MRVNDILAVDINTDMADQECRHALARLSDRISPCVTTTYAPTRSLPEALTKERKLG